VQGEALVSGILTLTRQAGRVVRQGGAVNLPLEATWERTCCGESLRLRRVRRSSVMSSGVADGDVLRVMMRRSALT
jgi:hypothetical protein